MIRKALSLVFVLFCVNIVLSAISCRPRAIKPATYCRSIGNTSLIGIRGDNSALSDGNNAVVATELKLRLLVNSKAELCKNTTVERSYSFFNKAYAYEAPNYGAYPRLDSIVSFDIISDKAYDDAHPAGSSLKGSIFTTDDAYILRSLAGTYTEFYFYCVQAPAETGDHTFTVTLVKSNGETIQVSSIPMRVIK